MSIGWRSAFVFLLLLIAQALFARDSSVIRADYDAANHRITGTMTINIEKRDSPLRGVRLQLYPHAFCPDQSDCVISIDRLRIGESDLTADLEIDGTDAWVALPERLSDSAGPLTVAVEFTTNIPRSVARTGYTYHRVNLEAWCPLPAPWIDGQWRRVSYTDYLEPAVDLQDFDVTFRFPDSLQIIAPGLTVAPDSGGMSTAHILLEAAQVAPIVMGHGYLVDSTQTAGTNLKIYYKPADAFEVDSARVAIREAMEYLSNEVAPYPYDELLVVLDGLLGGGGLEQPRMILAVRPPSIQITKLYRNMLIHETAHEWFYGLINSYQAIWPWMDEGVADYFAATISAKLGPAGADEVNLFGFSGTRFGTNRQASRAVLDEVEVGRRGDRFFDGRECYSTIYDKGALVIKTITGFMGREREKQFWRDYAERFAQRNVTPEDFYETADQYLPDGTPGGARKLLELADAPDYSLVNLVSVPVEDSSQTDSTDSAGGNSSSLYDIRITYECKHPVGWPVDMQVAFYDGTTADTSWIPRAGKGEMIFRSSSPAIAAEIDPHHKYAIDTNLLNNSISRDAAQGAGLRLFSGATFLIESLFSTMWGI